MRTIKFLTKPFSRLTKKQRAIILLYIAGFTYREIQDMLITSPNYIRLTISTAYEEGYGKTIARLIINRTRINYGRD